MEWTQDVSLGQWIVEGTSGHLGNGVNDLVPRGFEAYARIPHPEDAGRLPFLPQVVHLLMGYTSTPDSATAAIWEGWGGLVSSGGRATLMLGEVRAYPSFLAQAGWALQQMAAPEVSS